ncbi:hypothetical protein [Lysobacter gummosus]
MSSRPASAARAASAIPAYADRRPLAGRPEEAAGTHRARDSRA